MNHTASIWLPQSTYILKLETTVDRPFAALHGGCQGLLVVRLTASLAHLAMIISTGRS
jgi:hypothetical protein